MPHFRQRHLQVPFDNLIKHARIIGILGQRQVGKTTFLQHVAKEYVSLDDEDCLKLARKSPKAFLATLKGNRSGIDECQIVPGMFPALKVLIGTSSKPGRFILSGSVRFTSRKAIRESLTGRISNLELYPFVLTEIEGEKNSSFLNQALETTRIESLITKAEQSNSLYQSRTKAILKYFTRGGMPGLFNIREEKTQHTLLRDLTDTILDRDLRLVYKTSLPYQHMHQYCTALARTPLQIVRPGTLSKSLRLSEHTQIRLLHALESVFLVRRIPVEGDYKGDLYWFEDQTFRNYFSPGNGPDDQDWITLIYRNARAQFNYRLGENAEYFNYRTRGGAQVPLGIRTSKGVLGIVGIKSHSDLTLSLKRSAESFLKRYNYSKVVFLTYEGNTFNLINDRTVVVPAQVALFE